MNRLTGFSPLVRKVITERAAYSPGDVAICEVQVDCLGSLAVQHHHRRPRGSGGSRRPETNGAANGLAVCGPCHLWIETNRKEALAAGWLVPQHRTPSEIPVRRRGVRVMLADDGFLIEIPELEVS